MNHAAGRLTVVIEDDGVGFDPAAVEKRARRGEHLGLLGMTERVRNAGGTIEFQASEGGGSRIFVVLPCEPAADSLPREMETDR
jgi:signal transduction histidine kinase